MSRQWHWLPISWRRTSIWLRLTTNLQEYEKSLLSFLTIKDNFQRDWEIYFYLGKAYKKAGNEEEALVNLLKAAYLAPNQYCAFLELGLLYEKLGETRKALDYYYRAHRLYLEEEQREYGKLEDNSNQSRKTKTGNEVNRGQEEGGFFEHHS